MFAEEHNLNKSLFKAILRKMDFEHIQFEKGMRDFSEGQKKKILIAKSLCEKAHLYVWDESLNFVDIYSRMQIEQLIEQFSPTMLWLSVIRRLENNSNKNYNVISQKRLCKNAQSFLTYM